jgi:voltage-gated potassium channel Kch
MSDFDLYEALDFPSARMIISTVPDLFDNLNLLNGLKKYSSKGKRTVILTANDDKEANILYKTGVDYVLVPNQVGGDFLAGLIEKMLMR